MNLFYENIYKFLKFTYKINIDKIPRNTLLEKIKGLQLLKKRTNIQEIFNLENETINKLKEVLKNYDLLDTKEGFKYVIGDILSGSDKNQIKRNIDEILYYINEIKNNKFLEINLGTIDSLLLFTIIYNRHGYIFQNLTKINLMIENKLQSINMKEIYKFMHILFPIREKPDMNKLSDVMYYIFYILLYKKLGHKLNLQIFYSLVNQGTLELVNIPDINIKKIDVIKRFIDIIFIYDLNKMYRYDPNDKEPLGDTLITYNERFDSIYKIKDLGLNSIIKSMPYYKQFEGELKEKCRNLFIKKNVHQLMVQAKQSNKIRNIPSYNIMLNNLYYFKKWMDKKKEKQNLNWIGGQKDSIKQFNIYPFWINKEEIINYSYVKLDLTAYTKTQKSQIENIFSYINKMKSILKPKKTITEITFTHEDMFILYILALIHKNTKTKDYTNNIKINLSFIHNEYSIFYNDIYNYIEKIFLIKKITRFENKMLFFMYYIIYFKEIRRLYGIKQLFSDIGVVIDQQTQEKLNHNTGLIMINFILNGYGFNILQSFKYQNLDIIKNEIIKTLELFYNTIIKTSNAINSIKPIITSKKLMEKYNDLFYSKIKELNLPEFISNYNMFISENKVYEDKINYLNKISLEQIKRQKKKK
jgi:hypothetical protein